MSGICPENGGLAAWLPVDVFPCIGTLAHAVCDHVPLRVPFCGALDQYLVTDGFRQTLGVVVDRLCRAQLLFRTVGGHVPLVTPFFRAMIECWCEYVADYLCCLSKVVKSFGPLIHAVFYHVVFGAPLGRAFCFHSIPAVGWLGHLRVGGAGDYQSCGCCEGAKEHSKIPFVQLWCVARSASNQGEMQAPVAIGYRIGGDVKDTLSSRCAQFEGGRAYPLPSILPVELGRVADAMRPFFMGVAHVE